MHLPKELGLAPNLVGRLVRCAYGCRDAGHIWELCYRSALEAIGFTTGAASPCCFYHKTRDISVVVHGDDFTALGTGADLDHYEQKLAEHFELKIRGRIGEGCAGPNEIRILNRCVKLTTEGLIYEADPRHVDLLADAFNLTSKSSGVGTPGVKEPDADGEATKSEDGACTAAAIPFSDDDTAPHEESYNSKCSHKRIGEADTLKYFVSSNNGFQSPGDRKIATEMAMGMVSYDKMAAGGAATRTRADAHKVHALHGSTVTFNDTQTHHSITPYSDHYTHHPSQIVATSDGFKLVKTHADRLTGKCVAVMDARKRRIWNRFGLEKASAQR